MPRIVEGRPAPAHPAVAVARLAERTVETALRSNSSGRGSWAAAAPTAGVLAVLGYLATG